MARVGRKFVIHGAFAKKSKAKAHQHSTHCVGCFTVERKIKGDKRFVVLSGKR